MFGDLFKRITGEARPRLVGADARLALGALLVRIARADGHYDSAEAVRITQVLGTRYGLSDAEAVKLRGACEEAEREAPDTVRFTRAIKDTVPYEDRKSVVRALWQIALADGVRDDHEDALVRMVAPMLGVSDQDSNGIRRAVEAEQ